MEDYFCFDNGSRLIPNNEVQRNLELLNSLNSSFQNGDVSAASFVNLPASISRMEQLNVDSTFRQNADMNSLVSGTNLLVNSDSLGQMIGNTNAEPFGNLLSPLSLLESNNGSNSVIPGFPDIHNGEDTGNELKRRRMQHSLAAAFESNGQARQIVNPAFMMQDPRMLFQMEEVPTLDVNHEELLQQHLYQQILLKQDLMQVQNQNMQLKALIQRHRQQNYLEQQILQSVPQFKRFNGFQNEDQLRHLLQCQQTPHQISPISSFPVGFCSRRVMQYLYHLRNRPQDNNIGYWRKLVSEYYAPGAKIRRCFSSYTNLKNRSRGGFLHTMKERWTCDVCGSRSGIGFETNFEMLPRLFQNNFGNDLVDEILFLEMPRESKLPSGFLMLEYGKSVIESVYKQGRVVHEGKIRVLFRQDLKILSWEFCALKHEEFLVRHQISSQVVQLVETAEKWQAVDMDSAEDFKSNCNKFAAAGHQLAKTIDLPFLVSGLGLPNTYVRCLQMAEVFNTMGDLMTFSTQNKMGPLECLKHFAEEESSKARGQSTRESTLTSASFSPGSGSVDSCLINGRALQAEREVSMTSPTSCKIVEGHTSIRPTGRMIKQEEWCLEDLMTGIPITSRMQIPQSADSAQLCSLSVSRGTKRANPESVGVAQNLEQQLVSRTLQDQERVTSSTDEGANNEYARGRVVDSSTAIGNSRVLQGSHDRNSSSSLGALEIKKEPHFFYE